MQLHTFHDLEDYLHHLEKYGMVFGLKNIRAILSTIGDPHHSFRSIHIAGSNGKGSVAAMIHQILVDLDYSCGLYTSPHLQRFSERFKINNREITEEELLKHAQHVLYGIKRRNIQEGFTYFDFTTAMAFDYFAQKGVEVAVIEAGLGGRLDSTNILKPEISVITPISLEHTQVLGNTLREIAAEKAGIIKPSIPVVIGKQVPEALKVLLEKAAALNAPSYVFGRDFSISIHRDTFDYRQGTRVLPRLRTSLMGDHQKENAATAIATLYILKGLDPLQLERFLPESLLHVRWPGRGEIFKNTKDPTIRLMLDGAHNPGGAETLERALTTLKFNRLHIMVGILADKDVERIVDRLLSHANHVIAVTPRNERAPDISTFAKRIRPFLLPAARLDLAPSIEKAFPMATNSLGRGDLLLITGSLYTVGEARNLIEKDPTWECLKM